MGAEVTKQMEARRLDLARENETLRANNAALRERLDDVLAELKVAREAPTPLPDSNLQWDIRLIRIAAIRMHDIIIRNGLGDELAREFEIEGAGY